MSQQHYCHSLTNTTLNESGIVPFVSFKEHSKYSQTIADLQTNACVLYQFNAQSKTNHLQRQCNLKSIHLESRVKSNLKYEGRREF